jgi:hypothetical protein
MSVQIYFCKNMYGRMDGFLKYSVYCSLSRITPAKTVVNPSILFRRGMDGPWTDGRTMDGSIVIHRDPFDPNFRRP